MTDIFDVAAWVSRELTELGFDHCFIGGVALQIWGETRVTRDVDLTVLTRFEDEESKIKLMLERFPSRVDNALDHALRYRVLLCQSENGIGIDIGLGGFSYEEAVLVRSREVQFTPEITLPVISAEDLIVMKVFAGRPRDWEDVRGILVRQGEALDWSLIDCALAELLDVIEAPERLGQLHDLRDP